MIRFRLYFDKDKETAWLNEMSRRGWAMNGFFAGFYRFEKCDPGEYIYQIDFGDEMYHVSDEYRELMEDIGAEIVALWGYWIILRKRAADGPFELYTDPESMIEHYTKIRRMFKAVTILELVGLFIEVGCGMAGNMFGWAFAVLIAALVLVCINAVVRTNEVIAELEEQKSGIAAEKNGRYISVLLPIGLLINSGMIMIEESVSSFISYPVHIFAIIMMAAGLVQTMRKRS